MYAHLGQQSEEEVAGQAAGQAAKDQAEKSSWPPTEGDYEAIGAAAGTAAGAYFGPAGAAVGSVVGTAVGSGVYMIVTVLGGYQGIDPNSPIGGTGGTCISRDKVAPELAKQCGMSEKEAIEAMHRWGVPLEMRPDDPAFGSGIRFGCAPGDYISFWARNHPVYNEGVDEAEVARQVQGWQKQVFAGAAAVTAECATKKAASAPAKSSSAPLLIGAAIAAGVAWWLLA